MKVVYFALFSVLISSRGICQLADTTILTVTPSSGIISGRRISNYENVWKVTRIEKGKERFLGDWYDTVKIEDKAPNQYITRKQVAKYSNGNLRVHYDKVNRENLLPISVNISSKEDANAQEHVITDLTYNGVSFSGIRGFDIEGNGTIGEVQTTVNFTLKEPIYDWHLWGILIAAFPLEEQYSARFLAHTSANTTRSPFLWITLRVKRSEIVQSEKWGEVECWVVEVEAEVPWTFWIAKKKLIPPLQQIKIDESNLHGFVTWWKPIK